jgi:hypothetical protein
MFGLCLPRWGSHTADELGIVDCSAKQPVGSPSTALLQGTSGASSRKRECSAGSGEGRPLYLRLRLDRQPLIYGVSNFIKVEEYSSIEVNGRSVPVI